MSRRAWALAIALIVGGVVLQIPAHDGMKMPEMTGTQVHVEGEPHSRRIDLEVTGMT